MEAALLLVGIGAVAGLSFTVALWAARFMLRVLFALAGVRDIR